ncbi:MAG: cupredoxin domain-containing protein [Actinomycetota bacterium]|nr:cupredoxin domain-containing protein [Actinomycetota bacterium]
MTGLAGALIALGASPAHAVVAAAGPGSFTAGYLTPVVAVPKGGPLTFVNHDVADHSVTAKALLSRKVAKKTAYCKSYTPTSCPLFTSAVIVGGESGAVQGLGNAKPGRHYEFACRVHGNMRGILVVAGSGSSR